MGSGFLHSVKMGPVAEYESEASSDEEDDQPAFKRFCYERSDGHGSSSGIDQPGPSKPFNDYERATFSDSESDDDKLADFDRESLLKEIDADIKSITNKDDKK